MELEISGGGFRFKDRMIVAPEVEGDTTMQTWRGNNSWNNAGHDSLKVIPELKYRRLCWLPFLVYFEISLSDTWVNSIVVDNAFCSSASNGEFHQVSSLTGQ
jgi:hypothetical protein